VDSSFDDLYYASYRSILRAVVFLVPSREDAHDVVQEAYARALSRWDDVRALDNPEAWVRRVAVNAAVDMGRRERSRRTAYRRLLARPAVVPAPDEAATEIERALAALTPAQRQAIVMHHLLDMSVADIAAQTGRPTGTVKTNLARGRAAMAALLRERSGVVLDA